MILDIYPYGSRVYGVADEKSDTDLILVTDFSHEQETQHYWPGIDLTIWTAAEFQRLLDAHDPSALECWFLPYEMAIRSHISIFNFKLDLAKLRRAFSAKSSNSWVKAKKKIDVHGEWRLGLKSLFHSLRLLEFGLQLAYGGRIRDYSAANGHWELIQKQHREFSTDDGWKPFKDYWQPHYNSLRTDFRIAAPLPEGENE